MNSEYKGYMEYRDCDMDIRQPQASEFACSQSPSSCMEVSIKDEKNENTRCNISRYHKSDTCVVWSPCICTMVLPVPIWKFICLGAAEISQ